jgi:hypothetical protein
VLDASESNVASIEFQPVSGFGMKPG